MSGGAPAAWTPLDLSPSALYDAATPAAGAITAWNDMSGRAQHLDVGAATAVATGFNGGSQPYVQFNGTTNYLQRNAFDWGAALTAVSIGMVYVLDVATNGATVMRYGGTGTRPNLVQATSFRPQAATFGATTQTPAVNALQAPRVTTVRATRLASKRYNIPGTIDPADQTDGSDTHADDATLVFGAAAGGASGWSQMKVAMIWVVNRAISDAELAEWVAYAGARWGVPTS